MWFLVSLLQKNQRVHTAAQDFERTAKIRLGFMKRKRWQTTKPVRVCNDTGKQKKERCTDNDSGN